MMSTLVRPRVLTASDAANGRHTSQDLIVLETHWQTRRGHGDGMQWTTLCRYYLYVASFSGSSQPYLIGACCMFPLIDGPRVVACRCDQPFRCTQSEGRRRISDAASVRVKVQSITEWLVVCRHLRLDPSLCSVCRVTRRLKAQSKAPKRRLGGHWSHWVEFDISALQPRVCIADYFFFK